MTSLTFELFLLVRDSKFCFCASLYFQPAGRAITIIVAPLRRRPVVSLVYVELGGSS